MRCFFAIPIGGEAGGALAQALGEWRESEPEIRWESPPALHLTLQFIGDWPAERQPEMAACLEDWSWEPFALTLAGTGVFPNRKRPRVVWAGVDESTSLRSLADGLASRLARLGIPPEARNFSPHVSLARLRPGQHLLPRPSRRWGTCMVHEFCLFETVAGAPAATRYQARMRFPVRS